jgi:hypothetical protein
MGNFDKHRRSFRLVAALLLTSVIFAPGLIHQTRAQSPIPPPELLAGRPNDPQVRMLATLSLAETASPVGHSMGLTRFQLKPGEERDLSIYTLGFVEWGAVSVTGDNGVPNILTAGSGFEAWGATARNQTNDCAWVLALQFYSTAGASAETDAAGAVTPFSVPCDVPELELGGSRTDGGIPAPPGTLFLSQFTWNERGAESGMLRRSGPMTYVVTDGSLKVFLPDAGVVTTVAAGGSFEAPAGMPFAIRSESPATAYVFGVIADYDVGTGPLRWASWSTNHPEASALGSSFATDAFSIEWNTHWSNLYPVSSPEINTSACWIELGNGTSVVEISACSVSVETMAKCMASDWQVAIDPASGQQVRGEDATGAWAFFQADEDGVAMLEFRNCIQIEAVSAGLLQVSWIVPESHYESEIPRFEQLAQSLSYSPAV